MHASKAFIRGLYHHLVKSSSFKRISPPKRIGIHLSLTECVEFLQLFDWAPHKVANFAGVIALLAGVTMWITSTGWVRKKYFETFYWTHHLYIVFALFLAFHVGDALFNIAFCGLFLFVLDRFLRFCQSRSRVGILSTKLLPCGTFELTLAKSPGTLVPFLFYFFILPWYGR